MVVLSMASSVGHPWNGAMTRYCQSRVSKKCAVPSIVKSENRHWNQIFVQSTVCAVMMGTISMESLHASSSLGALEGGPQPLIRQMGIPAHQTCRRITKGHPLPPTPAAHAHSTPQERCKT